MFRQCGLNLRAAPRIALNNRRVRLGPNARAAQLGRLSSVTQERFNLCGDQGWLVTTRHSEGVLMGKVMPRQHSAIAALAAVFLTIPMSQAALSDDKQVFDEKPIKFIVGMPAGGGVDVYARLVQRHIVNFLPGPPSIIVQNMPGAGSLRSVMATLNSPPDEVVVNTFSSSLIMQAISE